MPQELVDAYARLGYDFLAITDHDVYTSATDHESLEDNGLILITGVEATANGPHVLCLNGDRAIEPSSDRQAVIEAGLASGGFVIPAHLNRESSFDHTPITQLRLWDGYEGIEIFNGQGTCNPGVHIRLPSGTFSLVRGDVSGAMPMTMHTGWIPSRSDGAWPMSRNIPQQGGGD